MHDATDNIAASSVLPTVRTRGVMPATSKAQMDTNATTPIAAEASSTTTAPVVAGTRFSSPRFRSSNDTMEGSTTEYDGEGEKACTGCLECKLGLRSEYHSEDGTAIGGHYCLPRPGDRRPPRAQNTTDFEGAYFQWLRSLYARAPGLERTETVLQDPPSRIANIGIIAERYQ